MRTEAQRLTLRAMVFAVALAACAPTAERQGTNEAAAPSAAEPSAAATDAGSATASASASSRAAPSTQTAPSAPLAERAADSLRGVVERVGSDPTTRLIVRGVDGAACALQIAAPASLEGLDVTLWGTLDRVTATMLPGVTCTLTVARFSVRAVDGIAAVDGVLRTQGAAYALETADGARRPLRDVPAPLRTRAGARIYWAGPLDRAPAAYGILSPAP